MIPVRYYTVYRYRYRDILPIFYFPSAGLPSPASCPLGCRVDDENNYIILTACPYFLAHTGRCVGAGVGQVCGMGQVGVCGREGPPHPLKHVLGQVFGDRGATLLWAGKFTHPLKHVLGQVAWPHRRDEIQGGLEQGVIVV